MYNIYSYTIWILGVSNIVFRGGGVSVLENPLISKEGRPIDASLELKRDCVSDGRTNRFIKELHI